MSLKIVVKFIGAATIMASHQQQSYSFIAFNYLRIKKFNNNYFRCYSTIIKKENITNEMMIEQKNVSSSDGDGDHRNTDNNNNKRIRSPLPPANDNIDNPNKKYKEMLSDLLAFFEQLIHMDEVLKAQARVMSIKNALKLSGDKKREILFEISTIRNELRRLQDDILNSTRGTQRYITLLSKEAELLQKEEEKQMEFSRADTEESQNFTNLSNAINESYEKEKVYSHTLRNLGLVGTFLGSLLSFIGASIGFYLHNKKSGLIIENIREIVNETISREIGQLKDELQIDDIRRTIKNLQTEQRKLVAYIADKEREGWTDYFKRHSKRFYGWIYPSKN